jgi:hypothetical protein
VSDSLDGPAWASPEVFPIKPKTSAYGALSKKDARTEFDSFEALEAHVSSSRQSVLGVWTPDHERMVPPEAVPGLLEALRKRFVDLADGGLVDARRNSLIFGGLLLWALYAAASHRILPQDSQNVGLAGLLLLVLGLIPLYEAWKSKRSGWALSPESLQEEERDARFERWMDLQPVRLTFLLLFLMLVVGVAQIWLGALKNSVDAAGLLKQDGDPFWRFLTAPFLHGNLLHFGLNAAGLWYLGRRTESLMGWPHLLLGFFIAMVAGGVATDYFFPDRE